MEKTIENYVDKLMILISATTDLDEKLPSDRIKFKEKLKTIVRNCIEECEELDDDNGYSSSYRCAC